MKPVQDRNDGIDYWKEFELFTKADLKQQLAEKDEEIEAWKRAHETLMIVHNKF